MASSMCGPSNALSSLKNHTTADQSLQQDRLLSPASSSQIFRSQPTNNRQLDGEFDQFSANGGVLKDAHLHLSHHVAAPMLDGWASDFQRLHIGAPVGPSPLLLLQQQQQQQQRQRQRQGWAATGWHEEFTQRQQTPSHVAEYLIRGPSMGMYGGGFNQMQMGGPMYMGGGLTSVRVTQMSSSQQQGVTAQFDEKAFEQAFENAKVQLEESQDRERLAEVVREPVVEPVVVVEQERKEVVKDKEHDSDELARTAAQLLDSLSGNQSQKFQDSTFLALMRRLRDREVRVEGDKMVETVPNGPVERPAVQLST